MTILRGIAFICKSIICQAVFSTTRILHSSFQFVYWTVNGTQRRISESRRPNNYGMSAQILRIKSRFHIDFLLPYTMADFICSHEAFTSPDYVLADNVFLFFLEGDTAVFAETKPGVQIWRLKYGAFVREASEYHAIKLIRMPIHSLVTLGEKLGPPKEKICFLFNTARCGSTLLTQMIEHTNQCVAISEPDGLNYLAKKYRDMSDCPELRKITTNFINILCKPVKSPEDNKAYFIKLTAPGVVALPFIHELYPDAPCLFMYRHVTNVAKSIYRITQVMPILLFTLYGGRLTERIVEYFLNEMGISGKDYKMRYKDLLCMGTSSWCVSTKQYLDLRKQYSTNCTRCVRYEDLVADPLYAMRDILKYCGLPEGWAEAATVALKQDSQTNSILHDGYNFVAPELTEGRKKNMNEMLEKFRLPKVDESNVFEGILGYRS